MSDITIGQKTQLIATLALVGGAAALVAAQLPEIRRYMAMRSM